MITAYAVTTSAGVALKLDRAAADDYAAKHHGVVLELVERAAILRKFDSYVPADQASSMRYRILELEAALSSERERCAHLVDDLRRRVSGTAKQLASECAAAIRDGKT